METEDLKKQVQGIVKQSCELKNKYTAEQNAQVNYACIFSQSSEEFEILIKVANKIGKIIKDTPTGPLFEINPIKTVAGNLRLLKIRNPDKTRPERGDADFTVFNYFDFKNKYLPKDGFKLIERKDFEMIELVNFDFNVRAYFSNPPLDEQLGIK
ncbi:MAG: hypothetical protein J7K00_04530 [Candidatus Diapherotrites archaeon]|nr:hypothetical protein [Candidatus Diapherotrites archaeon]